MPSREVPTRFYDSATSRRRIRALGTGGRSFAAFGMVRHRELRHNVRRTLSRSHRRLHSVSTHLRGLSPNVKACRNIPALLIAGGKDEQAGTEDAETLWRSGRSAGAPWTFAIDPAATHGSEEHFVSNHALMIPWIAAVLRQRLAPDSTRLRPVTDDSGWLGNNQSADVVPHTGVFRSQRAASWLPDEVTARGWQTVWGAVK